MLGLWRPASGPGTVRSRSGLRNLLGWTLGEGSMSRFLDSSIPRFLGAAPSPLSNPDAPTPQSTGGGGGQAGRGKGEGKGGGRAIMVHGCCDRSSWPILVGIAARVKLCYGKSLTLLVLGEATV